MIFYIVEVSETNFFLLFCAALPYIIYSEVNDGNPFEEAITFVRARTVGISSPPDTFPQIRQEDMYGIPDTDDSRDYRNFD